MIICEIQIIKLVQDSVKCKITVFFSILHQNRQTYDKKQKKKQKIMHF